MSDRIASSSEPWQAIPTAVLRDKKLSPRAKGGLLTLLSHDAGWVRSCIGLLQKECDCGRDQARAIMKELVEAGYAELVQSHGVGGRFTSAYVVFPHSGDSASSEEESRSSPGTGLPPTVLPPTVPPFTEVEALDEESLEVDSLLEPKAKALFFEEFWIAFPSARKGSKRLARQAFERALKRSSAEAVIAGAQRYRDDPYREDEYTAGPVPWLNQDRWDDPPLPARHSNGQQETTHDRLRRLGIS